MKLALYLLVVIFTLGGVLLLGDRADADPPQWETKAVYPREISPARYRQVHSSELERLGDQGWQLVSVAPYVLLNEERGPEGRKLAVTQTYPAYFFQRPKPVKFKTRR
ncbi:MAG: hypothetical protein GY953_55370 [bacterium]|nr:hypothetical protein [bacterium]